ncbi:MAG: hypothetical protein GY906_02870 [bacterium]|nr:hypothetical protein [bacterium]
MRIRPIIFAILALTLLTQPLAAIQPGTDVFVPASARATGQQQSQWIMDMYIFNPGSSTASVTVYWLLRNNPNTSPASRTFSIAPGDTLVLDDVILSQFGLQTSHGAFRVTSDRAVVVNATSLNVANNTEYGQGVEAIAASNATPAGSTTHVVGLKNNDDFRTNITLVDATGQGSTATVEAIDTTGTVIGSQFYTLRAYEPIHESVAVLGTPSFADATLRVTVLTGAIITGASRVHGNINSGSGDPITLNPWWQCGGSSTTAGQYFGVLFTDRMRGIKMTVTSGDAVRNLAFESDHPNEGCTYFFPGGPDEDFGEFWDPPQPLADFLAPSGYSFPTTYQDEGGVIGTVTWTVQLQEDVSGAYYTGTVTGVGSGFSGDDADCNGSLSVGQVTMGKNPTP